MKRLLALLLAAVVVALLPAPGQAVRSDGRGLATEPGSTASVATGVLVTSKTQLSSILVQAIGSSLSRKIVGTSSVGGGVVALRFDRTLPVSAFAPVAKALTRLGPIVRIEPDLRATTDALPNDTYFSRQTNLWSGVTLTSTSSTEPAPPDYSIQAPVLWQSTRGLRDVVVAVVDGGVVSHSDLPTAVAGYDMIADTRVARDGNGRDSNATDPGNWSSGTYCPAYASTWHGSHVTGIIAAKRNNGIGISGIAPGVVTQPVRVMGQCGGSMSDIIAGIRWAAGGAVDSVPANKTPAKVINVSLTSSSSTCPVAYQDVIDEARRRGSLVVVSAGNQHDYVSTRTPANCAGVVSVGASTPEGRRTRYTNGGPTLGLMAPGGMPPGEGAGIWSTINSGLKSADESIYAQYSGTSMAAPAVSAAAALIYSLGMFSPDQVEQALKSSATTPPTYNANYDCGSLCGAGILNLANIPAPVGRPVLTGSTSLHGVLTIEPIWVGNPDEVTVQWLRGGMPIDGATERSYTVTPDDLGGTLTVQSTAHKQGFPDFSGLSTAKAIPKAASAVTLRLSATTAKRKLTRLVAQVALTVPDGVTPSGTVGIYVGSRRVAMIDLSTGSLEAKLPVFSETGAYSLKAVYSGDGRLASSTSPIVKVKVIS